MPPRSRPLAHAAFSLPAFVLVASAMHAQAPAQTPAAANTPVLQPSPLDSAAPEARRARAMADLVLAGDRTGAVAYLKAHGTEGYATSPTSERQLADLLAAVAPRTLTVVRYDALGGGLVGLPLAPRAGDVPAVALLVRVEPATPHRIRELGLARIGGEP